MKTLTKNDLNLSSPFRKRVSNAKTNLKRFIAISSLCLATNASASRFSEAVYNALGGDATNDNNSQILNTLAPAIQISNSGIYRAVIRNGNGSAVWIGNSDSKSYFLTAAHVTNSANNSFTSYNGTLILPVAGSVFYTQNQQGASGAADFGLLEYNGVLNPALFGGQRPILMDQDLIDNFLGQETAAVGYGLLRIGDRTFPRQRIASFAYISEGFGTDTYRTRSQITGLPLPNQSYPGIITGGDSGGGVFLNVNGEDILVGAISAGNGTTWMQYANVHTHKNFINSVVPAGVLRWFSDGDSAPIGETIALKALGNGRYVASDQTLDNVNWPLAANRNTVGGWEQFEVIDAGGGMISLLANGNGRFVAADRDLDSPQSWRLAANRTAIGGWEKFSWIENGDGTISLLANGNGRFVASDRDLDVINWPLAANRDGVGSWESFSVEEQ